METVGPLVTCGETDAARFTMPVNVFTLDVVIVEVVEEDVPVSPRFSDPGLAAISNVSEMPKEYTPWPLTREILA